MSDGMTPNTCAPFSADLAELALGILTGRERAAALAHVDTCARCAEELEQLSRTADGVLWVAPEVEPPVGFEVQLFSRMGVSELSGRRRIARSRLVLAVAAAVVALAIGLGVGWTTGSDMHTTTDAVGSPVDSADLVSHGEKVGHVIVYGGSKPWMLMSLTDSAAQGRVTCVVVTASGRTDVVGSFTASHGYGAWGAPLHVSPNQVRLAEVRSASGAVIATAPLS